MFDFKDILAGVLSTLGIKSFSKDEKGVSFLTKEQKTQLTGKWGEKFVQSFSEQLAATQEQKGALADTELQIAMTGLQAKNKENETELQDLRSKLNAADEKEKKLQASITEKDGQIAKLSQEPGDGDGRKIPTNEDKTMGKKIFKADMNIAYNKFYADKYYGRVSGAYSGSTTVDTDNLTKEFGKYVSNDKIDIIQRMLISTTSTALMSTIMTDKTEVRATTNVITSVLQQFVPYWTPKGKTTFTPLTIKNYKCKINVPIIPSDIMESILGYLYDEQLKPEEMPIVKYVLYQMVFPKLDEEREYALASGVYKESTAAKDGDEATDVKGSMDGYLTILSKELLNTKTAVNFLSNSDKITADNILDKVQAFCQLFKPIYKKMDMPIMIDPDLLVVYKKAMRKKYATILLSEEQAAAIEDQKAHFEPVEGMRATGCFFSTPKENWKHLISQDPQKTKIWMQGENYTVKIFGEYWESTGFWLADAIFAYLSDSQVAAYKTAAGITTNTSTGD